MHRKSEIAARDTVRFILLYLSLWFLMEHSRSYESLTTTHAVSGTAQDYRNGHVFGGPDDSGIFFEIVDVSCIIQLAVRLTTAPRDACTLTRVR